MYVCVAQHSETKEILQLLYGTKTEPPCLHFSLKTIAYIELFALSYLSVVYLRINIFNTLNAKMLMYQFPRNVPDYSAFFRLKGELLIREFGHRCEIT